MRKIVFPDKQTIRYIWYLRSQKHSMKEHGGHELNENGLQLHDAVQNNRRTEIAKLRKERTLLIDHECEKISKRIHESLGTSKFEWSLTDVGSRKSKTVYSFAKDSTWQLFYSWYLSYKIQNMLNIKAPNRHSVVRNVVHSMSDGYPKRIEKFDIASCYESIPHENLIKNLFRAADLDQYDIEAIAAYLDIYARLSHGEYKVDSGVPRGIFLSAVLAESYLQRIDEYVNTPAWQGLYSRYIDDILIIQYGKARGSSEEFKATAVKDICSQLKIDLNGAKYGKWVLDNSAEASVELEYLGYEISRKGLKEKTSVQISQKKYNRLNDRIRRIFERYRHEQCCQSQKAKQLLDSLSSLTANRKLAGRKRKLISGPYFSSPLVTDKTRFEALDEQITEFSNEVESKGQQGLASAIRKFSFVNSFELAKNRKFTVKQRRHIRRD